MLPLPRRPYNFPVRKLAGLGFFILSCATGGQEIYVLRDPAALEDKKVWPLLVGEKIGVCVKEGVYSGKMEGVKEGSVILPAGPSEYLPNTIIPIKQADSILVYLPLHEGHGCLLVPVAFVVGGAMVGWPIYYALWTVLDPYASDLDEPVAYVSLASSAIGVIAGIYLSGQYMERASQSQAKTELFIKTIEGVK